VKLRTSRLDLVAGTVDIVGADAAGPAALAAALGAVVPPAWPPPIYDTAARDFMLRYLETHPGAEGFGPWYILLRDGRGGAPTLVGTGGMTGLPSPDGTVEIGYSVLDEYQRRGYATEAVAALLEWAYARPGVRRVIAHTFPDLTPSIRVLEKCGFGLVGPGEEKGTLRFEHERR
jgi:RimJ/RimL family protein N-acetyltransferase